MNRMLIAGVLLFLVALAGFLVVLPLFKYPGDSSDAADKLAGPGNIQGNQAVSSLNVPEPVLTSAVPTKVVEGPRGVEIQLQDLAGYEVGDEIGLYIPQEGRRYDAPITEVSTTESGNRVLTGFIPIDGGPYRFTFTVGRLQTFGTLQTNLGLYQLEVRDGQGWIISTRQINEKLDFSQPDYVVPGRKESVDESELPEAKALPPEIPRHG